MGQHLPPHLRQATRSLLGIGLLLALSFLALSFTYAQLPATLVVGTNDNGRQISLYDQQILELNLPGTIAAGYLWEVVAYDPHLLRPLGPPIIASTAQLGAPSTQSLRFQALGSGQSELILHYRRPWETSRAPLQTFQLSIQSEASTTALNLRPEPQVPQTIPVQTSDHDPNQSNLPSSFSWCANGGCTPIKDQGNCGSCWAFTTVGVTEAAIKLKTGQERDLSEQFLISCNTERNKYSCDGGWYAFDYYVNKPGFGESLVGAVYERDFPYQAQNGVCNPPYQHHEQLLSWHYVEPSRPFVVNATANIKAQLYTYGPIATSVCVGPAFANYRSGIFTSDESAACGTAKVNHGVIIVGWDDSTNSWLMRNSWGTWWGEQGYMRIAYGTSNIGYGSAYVVYPTTVVAPSAPTELRITASTSSTLSLAWNDTSTNETGFLLERSIDGMLSWQQIASLAANQTSFEDTQLRCGRTYHYRVRAFNAAGSSAYSNTSGATTASCPVPTAPLVPTNFHVSATGQFSLTLAWHDNANNEDGYRIYRWNGLSWPLHATLPANSTSYTDQSLLCGEGYSYLVAAFNSVGETVIKDWLDGFTQPCSQPAPSAPTDLRVITATSSTISLTWHNTSSSATGFRLDRSLDGSTWSTIATTEAQFTSYTDTGLRAATVYHYRVWAYNSNGAMCSTVLQTRTLSAPDLRYQRFIPLIRR
ncbi:MAG: C1 family peptidase [Oscillochloridaceae bacterium umkhey_bin13]